MDAVFVCRNNQRMGAQTVINMGRLGGIPGEIQCVSLDHSHLKILKNDEKS
jgi:hypothetical protein